MKHESKTRIIKLGVVGVDSGKLIICDPRYISSEFAEPDSGGKSDSMHTIYRNNSDGRLWQFTYWCEPSYSNVNAFPGTYETIIPEYGKTPNQLIKEGVFVESDLDPTPHIPSGEFSFRGICKVTDSANQGGQLNYKLGHPGVAVAFRSGFGDGQYEVFAEIIETEDFGERVKKVWIELVTEETTETMNKVFDRNL